MVCGCRKPSAILSPEVVDRGFLAPLVGEVYNNTADTRQ